MTIVSKRRAAMLCAISGFSTLALMPLAQAQDTSAQAAQDAAKVRGGLAPSAPATGGPLSPTTFEPAETVFNRMDTGRSGFLMRDQVKVDGIVFDAADVNRDGRLSADEFSRAWIELSKRK